MSSLYPSLLDDQPAEEMEMQEVADSGRFFVLPATGLSVGKRIYRRLATENVQCVCSATYQIFFNIF